MHVNKPIALDQLEDELKAAGIQVRGLGLDGNELHTYNASGAFEDLPPGAAAVVSGHRASRVMTDAELRAEFSGASDTRKQDIRDMLLSLIPRDRVAMS